MSTDTNVLSPGFYRGRALEGSEQYGHTQTGIPQIAIDLAIDTGPGTPGAVMTTFLYFSADAAPFSIERLRVCGWKGKDISRLAGLDANEIPILVSHDTYEGKLRVRAEIATNTGRVTLQALMTANQRASFAQAMQTFVDAADSGAARAPRSSGGSSSGPGWDPHAGA